jgi:TRAP-type C4-dicarboxylate transport system substrate-binding protein
VRREREKREVLRREEDERWAGLDEKTVEMIKDKIEETREYMEKELQGRKEEYAEKIREAKGAKGKKK